MTFTFFFANRKTIQKERKKIIDQQAKRWCSTWDYNDLRNYKQTQLLKWNFANEEKIVQLHITAVCYFYTRYFLEPNCTFWWKQLSEIDMLRQDVFAARVYYSTTHFVWSYYVWTEQIRVKIQWKTEGSWLRFNFSMNLATFRSKIW